MFEFPPNCPTCGFLEDLNHVSWYYCSRDKDLVAHDGPQPWQMMKIPLKTTYAIQENDKHFSAFAQTTLADLRPIVERHEQVWIMDFLTRIKPYNDDVKLRIAECLKHPLRTDFINNLRRLNRIGENRNTDVLLGKDFAPLSFNFSLKESSFHGGLIFHGAHDGGGNGGAPTYSVNLEPVDGWSIHT